MNVPNILTMFRVVFAIAVFYFCAISNWDLCLSFFVLAALTDFVDGWWARKFKQVTVFGRIMDPFADKFLICGVFICLITNPTIHMYGIGNPWGLQPWMVIVIISRELLITSLRAFVEKSGGDFSAKWIGKWKMGFQCIAVIFHCIVFGAAVTNSVINGVCRTIAPGDVAPILGDILIWTMIVSTWATVLITIYSCITYCFNAVKIIRQQS